MPEKCAVFGCNNVWNEYKGIQLNPILVMVKAIAKNKQYKKSQFCKIKTCLFKESTKHLAVCSEHFTVKKGTN